MSRLNHRVHVLLDDERLKRLRERAEATGASVGSVIRAAVDRELEETEEDARAAAFESFLSASPLPVGTPDELDRELETMWDRKPWPEP
jgi:Ribbon-helix-helix protein, copG family